MPANDRMDWLVEKATELGVHQIQPLITERAVLRLNGERAERKQSHWQGIAVAAAEQCGRTKVPVVMPVLTLAAWLATGAAGRAGHRCWVLSPLAGVATVGNADGRPVVALSGPEGGLSPDELTLAVAHGFAPCSLGPRVLRADTAPIALLAGLTIGLA
jgi:16S rRNA (uracil1498-N3)-methyltransferase